MKIKFDFAGQGSINNTVVAVTRVNEQLTVPLPSLGLVLNYNITPKLQFQSRYDFFYLTMANYSGACLSCTAGLSIGLSNTSPWVLHTTVCLPT